MSNSYHGTEEWAKAVKQMDLQEKAKERPPVVKTHEQLKAERLAQQKAEKERRKQKEYMGKMISRAEAANLATGIARQEFENGWKMVQEPIRAAIIQTMAMYELLKDKGIFIDEEEFNKYLKLVQDRMNSTEGEANGEKAGEQATLTVEVRDSIPTEETQD